jgi:type IV pilus assembly protein PilA
MREGETRREAGRARAGLRRHGFTLIELVIVVSMLSALAALAIPHLLPVVYKARRNEAYGVLKSVYAAQQSFMYQHGLYADTFDQLGIAVEGGNQIDPQTIEARYYTYTVMAIDGGRNFMALANGDIAPGNGSTDILIIRNNVIVKE